MGTRALLALLAVAIAAAGFALLRPRGEAAAPGRDGPLVLLERVVVPGTDGVSLAFHVPVPGAIEVRARGPDCGSTYLLLGPPLPVEERTGTWRPDPDRTLRLRVEGEGMARTRLSVAGTYVLRVEPIPTAMEATSHEVWVRVALRPGLQPD